MVHPVQYGGDEVSAIVLDIGSSTTRAGYAGEDCPKTVFPTCYATVPPAEATPATPAATADPRAPTYHHGQSLHLYRPRAVQANFISDGLVTDWDALERNLDYAFRDRLRLPTLADYPLLVTEPSWNPKQHREKMCELAFEKWDVPAYYAVDKAVMSAFASSRGSALVLDIGEEMTSLVPIYDGFVLRKAIQKQPTGGNLLSSILLQQIKAQSPPINIVPHYLVKSKQPVEPLTPALAQLRTDRMPDENAMDHPTTASYHRAQEMRIMHEFKESTCEVLPSFWDDQVVQNRPTRPFEFPDGYNAYFGAMRTSIPEVLFNPQRFLPAEYSTQILPPSLATVTSYPYSSLQPLTRLFTTALSQIDQDLHANLLNNVVVVGGTTLMQGFMERLNLELPTVTGALKPRIHAPATPAERMYSSWLGGSILGSLGTFHQLWIGADEYKEMGASVIHRRAK